jgi:hypothetical protein
MLSVDEKLLLWFVVFLFGLLLLSSKPRCNRGCKTIAEHLVTDGLAGFLDTLIG